MEPARPGPATSARVTADERRPLRRAALPVGGRPCAAWDSPRSPLWTTAVSRWENHRDGIHAPPTVPGFPVRVVARRRTRRDTAASGGRIRHRPPTPHRPFVSPGRTPRAPGPRVAANPPVGGRSVRHDRSGGRPRSARRSLTGRSGPMPRAPEVPARPCRRAPGPPTVRGVGDPSPPGQGVITGASTSHSPAARPARRRRTEAGKLAERRGGKRKATLGAGLGSRRRLHPKATSGAPGARVRRSRSEGHRDTTTSTSTSTSTACFTPTLWPRVDRYDVTHETAPRAPKAT